jgi:hypothetical protein
VEDAYFGTMHWDERLEEWQGEIVFPIHGKVGVALPPEYVESEELRTHIRGLIEVVRRDEADFRQRAASELFNDGSYLFFWPENQPFELERFAAEMHLCLVVFEYGFKENGVLLDYEYGEGMEHGISVTLSWDGVYRYAQL